MRLTARHLGYEIVYGISALGYFAEVHHKDAPNSLIYEITQMFGDQIGFNINDEKVDIDYPNARHLAWEYYNKVCKE